MEDVKCPVEENEKLTNTEDKPLVKSTKQKTEDFQDKENSPPMSKIKKSFHQCELCGKTFKHESRLRRHVATHTGKITWYFMWLHIQVKLHVTSCGYTYK